jgi:ParB family chromosome partitioning protein
VGYEIVAGERRFRAMTTILDRSFIPAIVRELDDESASAIMLAENTGRADLDPIEEANAYQSRIERFGWTEERLAKTAGVSTDRVKKRIALLALHDDVQHLVAHGNLPLGHAAAMFELDHNRQLIALRVFREGKGITLRTFRKVVADLLAEQNQDSLFDLATFYIEQSQEAEERILRGKGAEVPVPTRPDLPKAVMETTDSTSAVILNYIQQLESTGLETEAATIGTLYEQLIHGNCMGLPA